MCCSRNRVCVERILSMCSELKLEACVVVDFRADSHLLR